jgi:hypothetical protein
MEMVSRIKRTESKRHRNRDALTLIEKEFLVDIFPEF